MYKKLKKSIFGLFFISMMLFLIACSPKEVIVDEPVTYQLIFNTDGGTSISNQTYEVGSPIDIEALIPEKIGYTFKGWSPAAPNTMPANDLTLTAEWEANVYTINFNTDGGSLIEPLNQSYLSQISTPEAPTKIGYTFKGWSPALPDVMPLDGLTVTALWDANNYTISFDTDGGSVVDSITAKLGDLITPPTNPTKVGHSFVGWNMALPDTMPLDGLSLSAIWTINDYTIIFNTSGGSKVDSITLPYNEAVDMPNEPTKPGYNFVGWDRVLPEYMPDTNLTITAIWEKIESLEDEIFTENFEALKFYKENGYNSSEYLDYDYIGQSYVLWELINARIDLGMKKDGNAITLGGFGNEYSEAGMGRIYADEIFDGIKYLEFEARLPFSPKSSYPQGNGKDKAQNVRIKVYINGILIKTLQFEDDDEANKGTTFVIDDLNIIGNYSLSIEVSSGHRLTLDNIKWITNKNGVEALEPFLVDFESTRIDFDYTPVIHNIGGIDFMLKEVHTKTMHPEKELDFMDASNGQVVARFRGESSSQYSTPIAYMYNIDPISSVSKLTFDARLFGSDIYYDFDSVINIYYKTDEMTDFILLYTLDELSTTFKFYEMDIDKLDVSIKIEVIGGSVNIDNLTYIP